MWTGTPKGKAVSFIFRATQISCLQSRKSDVQGSMTNTGEVRLWGHFAVAVRGNVAKVLRLTCCSRENTVGDGTPILSHSEKGAVPWWLLYLYGCTLIITGSVIAICHISDIEHKYIKAKWLSSLLSYFTFYYHTGGDGETVWVSSSKWKTKTPEYTGFIGKQPTESSWTHQCVCFPKSEKIEFDEYTGLGPRALVLKTVLFMKHVRVLKLNQHVGLQWTRMR